MKLSDYDLVLRSDFTTFIERCFSTVSPGDKLQLNWHIERIAMVLEKVRRGETRRLIITLPPRNLKSICVSVAFPAWLLGHDPECRIICASYGQELANTLARDTRRVMESDWYRRNFPGAHLDNRQQSIHDFATTRRGGRMATSIGGTLTGRGADYIIIDDPLKPQEALSDVARNGVNEWFSNTLYSRLNSKEEGCIIVIMQRVHENDLAGYLMEQGGWEVLNLPAISMEEEHHHIVTPLREYSIERKPGDVLHPARESREVLDDIRKTLGEENFAGQYQQRPAPPGGGLIKLKWFRRYDSVPNDFSYCFQSWDTANKATELSDYSVCTTWGVKNGNLYLLDVYRTRLEFPYLLRAVKERKMAYGVQYVIVEDAASGTPLSQSLIYEGVYVEKFKPEGDKIIRMHARTPIIENGRVFLPKTADWLEDFEQELSVFPRGKHDDQVDSLSQALAWYEWHSRNVVTVEKLRI